MTTLFDIKAHKGDIGGSICTPYKFNGKELDQETGYYYYGARYYDPGTALWFGTDPLAHKYPMNSPYIYCNGNPIKYVDPDGRWPWENRNIRDARAFASQNGFEVQLIDGKYGKDAVVVKDGNVVTTYSARLSGQKTWYDNLDDPHNDCANLGTTTKQDIAVATGVIGVITGGMALAGGTSVTGAIVTASGIANSIDDIGTNTQGESFVQQSMGSKLGHDLTTLTKSIVSIAGVKQDINTFINTKSTIYQIGVSAADLLNSSISLYYSLIKK